MWNVGSSTAAITCSLLLPLCGIAASGASGQEGRVSGDGARGTLVVVNKAVARANIIDVASGSILATLPTGEGPHEVAVSSDGRTAVVTNYGAGSGGRSLTVLDVAGQRVERTIELGEWTRPHGIQFLPGDSLVAVTSEAGQAVVLVRVADGEVTHVLRTEAGGSHMLAATGDGGTIYTGDMQSNTVTELDVGSGGLTRAFPVPARPEAVTVSSDGATVWVGSNAESKVSTVDTRTGEVTTVLEDVVWPYRILLVPARDLVVVPDLRGNTVRFARLSTLEELEALPLPGGPQGVAVTPDQQTLFLSVSQQDQVAVIDLETRRVVRRIATGRAPDGIQWSPLSSVSPR